MVGSPKFQVNLSCLGRFWAGYMWPIINIRPVGKAILCVSLLFVTSHTRPASLWQSACLLELAWAVEVLSSQLLCLSFTGYRGLRRKSSLQTPRGCHFQSMGASVNTGPLGPREGVAAAAHSTLKSELLIDSGDLRVVAQLCP